jgi:L-ascorbate metabolism protein UlaG (beta-lactamase superfamily)
MIITYHAGEAVKVSAGDTTLAFGPVSKESKLKSMSFGSDVVFVSANHPDMNGVAEASRGDKAPFAINGPGEYEVGSITAAGFATKTFYGGKELINTIYTVTMDGLHVLYLGAIGEMQLPADAIEAIEDVDVVFVPIGGSGVLDAQEAHKLAVKLEAKIIIPIHWEGVGDKDALKLFLKEAGVEKAEMLDKLTIKPKDVAGKAGEVVVLKA